MAKISAIEIPSLLLADQGSDPATPAAGFKRLYGKSAGLYLVNSSGTVVQFLPASGGTFTGDISVPDEAYGVGWNGSVEVPTKNAVYDKIETLSGGGSATWELKSLTTVRYTAGNLNLQTATIAWANMATATDLTAAAVSGDRARVYLNALASNESAAAFIDAVTLVSAAPVNSFGQQGAVTSGPPFYGIPAWRCHASAYTNIGAMAELVLGAGDVSGGNVTIRFRSCTDANSAKTLFSGTNYALTAKLEIWSPI